MGTQVPKATAEIATKATPAQSKCSPMRRTRICYAVWFALVQSPDGIHLALRMRFLWMSLSEQASDLGCSIKALDQAKTVQLLIAECIRESSTVSESADLSLFLD